ncbi:hypothetical protein Peur_033227 [Populus x canadensis]
MAAKLFLTATIVVLISALIAINHEFLYQPSVIDQKGHGQLWEWETLSLDGATGPESFALDPLGQVPYAGISDGRIIKWEEQERRWINFAITSQKRYLIYIQCTCTFFQSIYKAVHFSKEGNVYEKGNEKGDDIYHCMPGLDRY